MEDLIKALQIFLKYENKMYPTYCEHDVLYVDIDPSVVSDEDKKTLDELGFLLMRKTIVLLHSNMEVCKYKLVISYVR